MKHTKTILLCFIFSIVNIFVCNGQERKSIYENGIPVTNHEANFKNLFSNWKKEYIVNAEEFNFLECSFVETIKDQDRFVYYRNYFSGTKPVGFLKRQSFESKNGIRTDSIWVYPGYAHSELFDTANLPEEAKKILTEDILQKGKKILTEELNIDTMKLHYHSMEKRDSTVHASGKSQRSISMKIATPQPLSQNYIDVYFTFERDVDELSNKEKGDLFLEELLITRIRMQRLFNSSVEIGDKVYLIKFTHDNKTYDNYIICSTKTNKVVFDNCFRDINITPKEHKLLD